MVSVTPNHFIVCQDNHHIHKLHVRGTERDVAGKGHTTPSGCQYINLVVTTSPPAWLLPHSLKFLPVMVFQG